MHPFANHAVSGGPPPLPTVLGSKLAPPVAHPATIGRPHLIARMAQDRAARVILVRAAAGFGKTTLMQQIRGVLRSAAASHGVAAPGCG